ncbi:MAG: pilus assembly protein PilM [Candidatus Pelagibacter sp.]
MSDEDKDNIYKEDEVKVDENQSKDENKPSEPQSSDNTENKNDNNELTQSESESSTNIVEEPQSSVQTDQEIPKTEETKKEHEVIHKKDGRLHIYVRQDKYKGELKSKNWVGRLYIDGKQKISSSGTPNLEEAIPILEKWFDDVHKNKDKEEQISKETVETSVTTEEQSAVTAEPTTPPTIETPKPTETTSVTEKAPEPAPTQTISASVEDKEASETKTPSSFLDKLKNIKLKKPSFASGIKTPKISALGKGGFKSKLDSFFKSKLGKSSAQGEEILGVEITNKEIRLAQISSNKANQWVLEKFFVHKVDLPDDAAVLENAERLGGELSVAIQKSKITTPNAAIAIPVTSAIIRVVTAPLMKEEELNKAIETNSLWENLVQLTDNLDDYSIFHQVINRNDKENTMDILFVASKLADINSYTSIIKSSGLNAVIIDVKCFALKSAVDQINLISKKTEDANLTAVLEFGLDENYLMILYDNNPIITDIFLRGQDRKILKESENQEEKEALVRRFVTQVKQAVQDFETKYEKRIRNIKVVSDLTNIEDYLSIFRKNLVNIGFKTFDPLDGLNVPQQLEQSITQENRSYLTTVIGLAFRKLDVFGYYKFVTAVKNINLLPNRQGMVKQKKMKAISNFAFKGVVGAVVGIYLVLFALSFWNIHSYNKKLLEYDNVVKTHLLKQKELKVVNKELGIINTALKLSGSLKSNKDLSYRILAQIASSVPKRLRFDIVDYDGKRKVTIQGVAASDQDILKFIDNLGKQNYIKQASLSSMKLPGKSKSGITMKGFRVFVLVDPTGKSKG